MSISSEDTTRVLRRHTRPDQLGETDADDDLADDDDTGKHRVYWAGEARGMNRGLELAALVAKHEGHPELAALFRRQKAKES